MKKKVKKAKKNGKMEISREEMISLENINHRKRGLQAQKKENVQNYKRFFKSTSKSFFSRLWFWLSGKPTRNFLMKHIVNIENDLLQKDLEHQEIVCVTEILARHGISDVRKYVVYQGVIFPADEFKEIIDAGVQRPVAPTIAKQQEKG